MGRSTELTEADAWPGEPSRGRCEPNFFAQGDVARFAEVWRARAPLIGRTAIAVMTLALIYLALAPVRYAAEFSIMVDPQKTHLLQAEAAEAGDRAADPGLIDSQVEILKSNSVLLPVVRKLRLIDDPDLILPHGVAGWTFYRLEQFTRAFLPERHGRRDSPRDRELLAAAMVRREMSVKRVGMTYVIQVDYYGYQPEKVSAIGNAIADAYVVGELEARYGVARQSGDWLRDRIREVGEQASDADVVVQKFKTEHNFVDTSRGLITEQRLADANAQLGNAGAAVAEAKARLDRVVEISNSQIGDVAVAESLHSDVISRLRAQYLDLDSREADYSLRFGKDHASVHNIHGQKIQIQAAAREELRRIAESARSDHAIAVAREQTLKSTLDGLVAAAAKNNEARGVLRNLEGIAETYRNLYETMLQKNEETTRQQSFPVARDRVITAADPPAYPSWPKPAIVIGGGAFGGIVLGFGLALWKEALGNTFRVGDDVTKQIGLDCLGIVPSVQVTARTSPRADTDERRLGPSAPAALRYCIAEPFSRFSETLRNTKVSIDLCRPDDRAAVIGVVSSVPAEGKTTISCNLALLCAQMGPRTILIDGDFHRRGVSRLISPTAELGLIELLDGVASVEQVVRRDAVTGLEFIPCVMVAEEPNAVARLASPAMTDLVAELRARYDYIVVDLPPIIPVADVRASAGLLDFFVLVVEWGRTRGEIVREALSRAEEVRYRTIGVVLNKADPEMLRRLEGYDSAHGGYAWRERAGGPAISTRAGAFGILLEAIGVRRGTKQPTVS